MKIVFAIYFLFNASLSYYWWGIQVPQVAQKNLSLPLVNFSVINVITVFIPFHLFFFFFFLFSFLYLELFFYSTSSVIEICMFFVFCKGRRGLYWKWIFYFEVLSDVLTLNLFTSAEPKWVKLFKEFLFFVTYNFL